MVFKEKVNYRLREHKRWEEGIRKKIEEGEVFCESCGTNVTENQNYCPKCGSFLVGDAKVKNLKSTPKKQTTEDLFKEFKLFNDKKIKRN